MSSGITVMAYWPELLLSILCGVLIGLEREAKRKPAGIRTCALVCLGSTLFTILSFHVREGLATDQTRIASNIVQGIGFLGAGTILRFQDKVIGLTTAAVIWVVAAIGMAIGFGSFGLAISTTVLTVLILILFGFFENKLIGLIKR